MTGFTRPAFMVLENILKPATQILKVGGRPPSLNFCGQLGLFLMWCCSRMRLKELCLIFACVRTSAHRYVKRMLQQAAPLLRKNDDDERISFPDNAEIARLAHLVHLRDPLIPNVASCFDGCSISYTSKSLLRF